MKTAKCAYYRACVWAVGDDIDCITKRQDFLSNQFEISSIYM